MWRTQKIRPVLLSFSQVQYRFSLPAPYSPEAADTSNATAISTFLMFRPFPTPAGAPFWFPIRHLGTNLPHGDGIERPEKPVSGRGAAKARLRALSPEGGAITEP